MEIIVEGKGIKRFIPNQVIMNINFITKDNNYDKVLELGSNNVIIFIKEILKKNNLDDKLLKTRNFVIREETKYNEITRKYEPDGYSYNQSATLEFDYDMDMIAKIMESISKLDNPPVYQINFGIKDEREARRSIIKDAYLDAENQAIAIAEASKKQLKECIKIDFKPFSTSYISETSLGNEMVFAKSSSLTVNNALSKSFTPEEIELSETLYCLWITE